MYRTTNLLLTLISISIFPFLTCVCGALQPEHQHARGGGCIPAERAALLSFKEGITSNNTNLLASWRGQDCCRWRGVKCSNQTGHVIKLHLPNPNVALDTYGNHDACGGASAFFGKISPSLLSLKRLEHLDLSWNCLLGTNSQIPDLLGSMRNLRYLNLSGIPFTGTVSSQLGNLSKLQYLDLGHSGMYSTDITWLTKLPSLEFLSMRGVMLLGIADWPHTLNMIPCLRVIDLSWCNLDSANQSLPHLNFTKLEKLDLSYNDFQHSLGSGWFWKVTSLEYLDLGGNRLLGHFPDTLGNMTYLQVLDVSMNGNRDMMMAGNLENLCSLEIIDLYGNGINGVFQVLLQSFPHCTRKKLRELDLSGNNFTETLPNFISDFTRLSKLYLPYNSLAGPIPQEFGNLTCLTSLDLRGNELTGSIPTEFGTLATLTSLQIAFNDITGSIPDELCNLRYLTDLDLKGNRIVGPIPPQLGNLTYLTSLDLHGNDLTGSIPAKLGTLMHLNAIDLSSNNLTGSIPSKLGTLMHLNTINLSSNRLTRSIPAKLRTLMHLTAIDLSSNHLNGSVPTEIGSLVNLTSLDLSNNGFTGVITEEHLANLTSLKEIDLSSNNLQIALNSDWRPPFMLESARFASCQMGPLFPPWLQQLETTTLDISSNGLKGKFPDWFWSKFSRATYLDISNNQISGSLPAHLHGMAFTELYLSSNRLTGPIPTLPTNITRLDMSNNTFTETIPTDLGASQLEVLCMHSNQIGGYIPESICKLEQLVYLDLSNNILEGEIPQCFHMERIQFLILSNNSLLGKVPTFLQNNTGLTFLDLSRNKLSGRLPTWIGKLVNLRFLILSHNNFSGNIPVDITKLGYLQYLDLAGNSFSGAIPLHLENLTCMKTSQEEFMGMVVYIDSGSIQVGIQVGTTGLINATLPIPRDTLGADRLGQTLSVNTKGQHLIYGRTVAYFVSIDLSSNSLTGEIPTGITSLAALMNLNLSSNQLSGKIPNMIGAMKSLESLDLSQNKLSGEIPSSLSSLTSLSYLSLSYNSLSGRIPSSTQLDTLNAENPYVMYIGNIGLCGPPVHKNCSVNGPSIHDDLESSKQEFEPLTLYFGLVMGFVIGLWMVFCALLFKKTWRIAYFRLFDKAYDHVYVFLVVKWASFTKNTDAY